MSAKIRIIIAAVLSVTLLVLIGDAWYAQRGAGRTCNFPPRPASTNNLVQIELTKQEPVEPGFVGTLYYYVDQAPKAPSITITTTGAQHYADHVLEENVRNYGESFSVEFQDYGLTPISGSHRRFPFDSADFDVRITSQPELNVDRLQVINRVDGFVIDCSKLTASVLSNKDLHIKFSLSRNPLIQLTALSIAGGSVAFAILIVMSKTIEALSGAAASSFFSMWSVRSILSSQIHVFPTVLDLIILTTSIALLMAVLWRVIVGIGSRSPNIDT